MNFKVAIVGRPNVGKSTFFNRLVGKNLALTHDLPGVTRDFQIQDIEFGDLFFTLYDTAGLEKNPKDELGKRILEHNLEAIAECNLIFLVVDVLHGLHEDDREIAKKIRALGKKIVLIANKAENMNKANLSMFDFYKLGFDDPLLISAEHNHGMADIYRSLEQEFKFFEENKKAQQETLDKLENKPTQIAIIGRPNAGKSTLINALIDKSRLLTGPEPGITRDAIFIDWKYKSHDIKLVDTAGLRKKRQVTEKLEKLAQSDSIEAINFAHIAVLLIDATIPLEKQDLKIISIAMEEGRGVVLAVNKIDLIDNLSEFKKEIKYMIGKLLPDVKNIPVVYCSSKDCHKIYAVIEESLKVYKEWNKRISTAKLNNWLRDVQEEHPLPLGKFNKRIRIKYVTQAKTRPPSFVLFSSSKDQVPKSYLRYLTNDLRKTFGFTGSPLRLILKKSDNPYSK